MKNVREYFYYLFREVYNKRTLFYTLVIGLGVSTFTQTFLWPAFGVPFLVLAVSRAVTNFRDRHIRMLLQLPSQREDPTFIMGLDGKVVLSTGKTRGLFERFSITNISEFVGADGLMIPLRRFCCQPMKRCLLPARMRMVNLSVMHSNKIRGESKNRMP